jgi:hypothetical protein
MVVILGIVSICELLVGVGVFATAKSAIHEILATLMLGFCFLTMALAAILEELRRSRTDVGGINISR